MNPDVKLEKLKEMLSLLDEGLTREEFVKSFSEVLKVVKDIKDTSSTEWKALKEGIDLIKADLSKTHSQSVNDIKGQVDQVFVGEKVAEMRKLIEDKIASVRDGIDGKDGKDGAKGEKGDKGDPGETGLQGNDGSPDTGIRIRDKLEKLLGDERIDASAIKNLPKPEQKKGSFPFGNAHNSLWTLMDVDVAGIVIGQSIKWDGIRWIPFTPASSGTSVYNEVVAGSATTFTLANTPTTGTLRVYANGQRLTPTTDYTLSGAIITTVSSWSATNITADYEY